MRIVFKLLALVMAAMWLPVTQHCSLEAAGVEFLTHCDHGSSSCDRDHSCAQDACRTVEGAAFSKDGGALRALPPVSWFNFCLLQLLTPPLAADSFAVHAADDPPEVQALRRTWQFVRRTALPARAPDFVA